MQDVRANIEVDPETGEESLIIFHNGEILSCIDNLGTEGYPRMNYEQAVDFAKFINDKNDAIRTERTRVETIVNNYRICSAYITNEENNEIMHACDDILKRIIDGRQETLLIEQRDIKEDDKQL